MKLEHILPRALGDSQSDCASIFTSLVMGAHFERSHARSLGWRGVRPSASEHPAWTCRVAGSDLVFGIRFDGEEHCDEGAPASSSEQAASSPHCLRGYFSLYAFPPTESSLLDMFPLAALQFALSPEYEGAIREFSGGELAFQAFRMGQLRLDASFAGDALALTLEAPARHRVLAADGIASDLHTDAPENNWLVAPGDPECNVPAFRLFMRLFAVLAATAEQRMGEKAAVFRGLSSVPRMRFHQDGSMEECPEEKEFLINCTASFGPSLALAGEALTPLRFLPVRYRQDEQKQGSRPVLHVLTGFLGAGKTTFLRRWLDFLHGRERYTGVIQNEFGKVALDAALMKGDTVVEALDEGCVCCSLADSLRPGLERIIAAMPAEQFVLETTGLANPSNIMEALYGLRDLVVPGLVITVADALDLYEGSGPASDGSRPENAGIRRAQIEKADVIIVNKSDMLPPAELETLISRLRALNGKALVLPAQYGNIAFAELDAWIDAHNETRLPSHTPSILPMGQRDVTHEEEGYSARLVTFNEPVSQDSLERRLRQAGPGLCRAKGILSIEGKGTCIVQYAAARLEIIPAPDEMPAGLTLIGTDPAI